METTTITKSVPDMIDASKSGSFFYTFVIEGYNLPKQVCNSEIKLTQDQIEQIKSAKNIKGYTVDFEFNCTTGKVTEITLIPA